LAGLLSYDSGTLRRPRRKDFAERHGLYVEECFRQIHEQGSTTNPQICKNLNIHPRRGSDHLKMLLSDYRDKVAQHGRKVRYR
jgi:hypothetical protein